MASGTKLNVLLIFTGVLLGLGILFEYLPSIIDVEIRHSVQVATDGPVRRLWSKPPFKIRSVYWLFSVDNGPAFLKGSKPFISRVGPFNFWSTMEKRIFDLKPNQLRIKYNSTRLYQWDDTPGKYQANLEQRITTPSLIYSTILSAAREIGSSGLDPTMAKVALSTVEKLMLKDNETILMDMSVRSALWGRKLRFLRKLSKFADTMGTNTNSLMPSDSPIAQLEPNTPVGILSATNNTWMGPFEVYTGYGESSSSLGDLVSFQGKRRLTMHRGLCNKMQTSAGELRPMPLQLVDARAGIASDLEMYRPEFCRVLKLRQVGLSKKLPIGHVHKFKFADENFESAKKNSNNSCYCYKSKVEPFEDYCSTDSVLELGECAMHAPLAIWFASSALDEKVSSTIDNWDPDLVDSTLDDLDERTNPDHNFALLRRLALPLKVDLTVVAFMKLRRNKHIASMSELPELSFVPLFMSRDIFELPKKFQKVIESVESLMDVCARMRIVCYLSAISLIIWIVTTHFCKIQSSSSSKKQFDYDQNNNNKQALEAKNNNDKLSSSTSLMPINGVLPVNIGQLVVENTNVNGVVEDIVGANRCKPLSEANEPIVAKSSQFDDGNNARKSRIFSKLDDEIERQMLGKLLNNNNNDDKHGGQLRNQVIAQIALVDNNVSGKQIDDKQDNEQLAGGFLEFGAKSAPNDVSSEQQKTYDESTITTRPAKWLGGVLVSIFSAFTFGASLKRLTTNFKDKQVAMRTNSDQQQNSISVDDKLQELAARIDNWRVARGAEDAQLTQAPPPPTTTPTPAPTPAPTTTPTTTSTITKTAEIDKQVASSDATLLDPKLAPDTQNLAPTTKAEIETETKTDSSEVAEVASEPEATKTTTNNNKVDAKVENENENEKAKQSFGKAEKATSVDFEFLNKHSTNDTNNNKNDNNDRNDNYNDFGSTIVSNDKTTDVEKSQNVDAKLGLPLVGGGGLSGEQVAAC